MLSWLPANVILLNLLAVKIYIQFITSIFYIFRCVSRKEFRELKDEVRCLKRKISPPTAPTSPDAQTAPAFPSPSSTYAAGETNSLYNGFKLSELQDISHIDKLYDAVKCLLLKLFIKEYILSHSVSGKAANSKTPNKCQFDVRLYNTMFGILKDKFGVKNKDITEKGHSVQNFVGKQKL